MSDWELLQEYAQTRSERAFGQLVSQHIDWVYSAAVRQVRDAHIAEDITQAVFLALAQRAASLREDAGLAPWLFQVTRYACTHAIRERVRRKHHEQKAAAMGSADLPVEDRWEELAPVLEALVARLGARDRQAVLLRFYEQKSFAEVGQDLGISEEAARKRTDRAVDRLRGLFERRGVTTISCAALAAGLWTQAVVHAAPAGLQATVTANALGTAAAPASVLSIGKGAIRIMRSEKVRFVMSVSIAVLLISGLSVIALAQLAERKHEADVAVKPAPASQATATTAPALGRYLPDPRRNVFAAGRLDGRFAQGRPRGWDDLSAFDTGNARLTGEYLELKNEVEGGSVRIGASLPLKPEWKHLAVAARLRGHNLEDGGSKDAGAWVKMTLVGRGGQDIRTVARFQPLRHGGYRDWTSPNSTFQVPEDAAALRIEPELADCTGILDVLWIVVTPVEPAKEIDPARIRALHDAIRAGDAELVKQTIEEDRRLLECRGDGFDFGTPLIVAAWEGQADVIRTLLELGADLNATDLDWHGRAVDWAAFWGRPKALEVLLDAGANAQSASGWATLGMTRKPGNATDAERLEVLHILGVSWPAEQKDKAK